MLRLLNRIALMSSLFPMISSDAFCIERHHGIISFETTDDIVRTETVRDDSIDTFIGLDEIESFEETTRENIVDRSTSYLRLPSKADFDEGMAGVTRVLNLNKSKDAFMLPSYGLVALNDAVQSLIWKVKRDKKPDIMDIALLVDTDGKLQTMASMYFLSHIEKELRESGQGKIQNIPVGLSTVFDSFIGSGSGAIPAAVGALGQPMKSAMKKVWNIPTKIICPRKMQSRIRCLNCIGNAAKSFVSAYYDEEPQIAAKGTSDWDSLTYDAFDFSKSAGKNLISIFGSSTTADLKSDFETISLTDSDSMARLVQSAILARDKAAKRRVKKLAVSELFSKAQNALKAISEQRKKLGKKLVKMDKAIGESKNMLDQLSIQLKRPMDKKGGSGNDTVMSLTTLRNFLLRRNCDIPRDLIILSISANTGTKESVPISTFSYDLKELKCGKNIVSFNYRFAVPSHCCASKKKQKHCYAKKAVKKCVDSLFPDSKLSKKFGRTEISTATNLLLDLLKECSARIIKEANEQMD